MRTCIISITQSPNLELPKAHFPIHVSAQETTLHGDYFVSAESLIRFGASLSTKDHPLHGMYFCGSDVKVIMNSHELALYEESVAQQSALAESRPFDVTSPLHVESEQITKRLRQMFH